MSTLKAGDTVRIKGRLEDWEFGMESVESGAIGELISLLAPCECIEPDGDCGICPNAGDDYHPQCWTEWYNSQNKYWLVRLKKTATQDPDEWYIADGKLANVADLI